MLGEENSIDDLYEILCDLDKLKNYQGFGKLMGMGLANNMTFYQQLPYDEIRQYVEEERESFMSRIPADVREKEGIQWEHIGSTSIKGMPGTNFPDALVLFNSFPPPREVFAAMLDSGFTFLGSGPMNTQDVWFIKKIEREGSILDNAMFKVHFNQKDFKIAQMLIEVRDRCNTNKEDFEDYKAVKCVAAKRLSTEGIHEYKKAKSASKLMQEMQKKYEYTV